MIVASVRMVQPLRQLFNHLAKLLVNHGGCAKKLQQIGTNTGWETHYLRKEIWVYRFHELLQNLKRYESHPQFKVDWIQSNLSKKTWP